MMLMCQPKLTIDVAPCFVLQANRFLVGILRNNGLRHSAFSYIHDQEEAAFQGEIQAPSTILISHTSMTN
jgi:hypothetical protein